MAWIGVPARPSGGFVLPLLGRSSRVEIAFGADRDFAVSESVEQENSSKFSKREI